MGDDGRTRLVDYNAHVANTRAAKACSVPSRSSVKPAYQQAFQLFSPDSRPSSSTYAAKLQRRGVWTSSVVFIITKGRSTAPRSRSGVAAPKNPEEEDEGECRFWICIILV